MNPLRGKAVRKHGFFRLRVLRPLIIFVHRKESDIKYWVFLIGVKKVKTYGMNNRYKMMSLLKMKHLNKYIEDLIIVRLIKKVSSFYALSNLFQLKKRLIF